MWFDYQNMHIVVCTYALAMQDMHHTSSISSTNVYLCTSILLATAYILLLRSEVLLCTKIGDFPHSISRFEEHMVQASALVSYKKRPSAIQSIACSY